MHDLRPQGSSRENLNCASADRLSGIDSTTVACATSPGQAQHSYRKLHRYVIRNFSEVSDALICRPLRSAEAFVVDVGGICVKSSQMLTENLPSMTPKFSIRTQIHIGSNMPFRFPTRHPRSEMPSARQSDKESAVEVIIMKSLSH